MKVLLLTIIVLSLSSQVWAQTVITPATAALEFNSADHTAVTVYRPSLWPSNATDGTLTGVPIALGTDIPKASVTTLPANASGPVYRVTFAQAGLSTKIPACTTTPCPTYAVMLLAMAGTVNSAPGVASLSDSFTLAPVAPQPPARPTNVKVKSS